MLRNEVEQGLDNLLQDALPMLKSMFRPLPKPNDLCGGRLHATQFMPRLRSGMEPDEAGAARDALEKPLLTLLTVRAMEVRDILRRTTPEPSVV